MTMIFHISNDSQIDQLQLPKFALPFAKTNTYNFSFFFLSINDWNRLLPEVTEQENMDSFNRP